MARSQWGSAIADVPRGSIAPALGASRGAAKEFADFLRALIAAQGDTAETSDSGGGLAITQQSWKLMADVIDYHPACVHVLASLFEGLAAGCGRHIGVRLHTEPGGRPPFVWSIG